MEYIKEYIAAFIAGFISTLTFHQGALALLHATGFSPKAAYATTATAPFQVPAVLSLAFWGGLWGIALWLVIVDAQAPAYWMLAAGLGAIGPSVIALFVVFPLKGQPVAGGWDIRIILGALILNSAWGLGVALFMRLTAQLLP